MSGKKQSNRRKSQGKADVERIKCTFPLPAGPITSCANVGIYADREQLYASMKTPFGRTVAHRSALETNSLQLYEGRPYNVQKYFRNESMILWKVLSYFRTTYFINESTFVLSYESSCTSFRIAGSTTKVLLEHWNSQFLYTYTRTET